ncbi:MAG: hypothetical protein V1891_00510 [bacterium]
MFNGVLVVVVVCLSLAACGGKRQKNSQNPFPDAKSYDTAFSSGDNPLGLPEYKELPEPGPGEPAAVLRVGEKTEREKSSNEFFDILRQDIEYVYIYFYSDSDHLTYEGSWAFSAEDFFSGIAEKKVKAGQHYLTATTYGSLSGNCFCSDASVLLLPNEANSVLFIFKNTGRVTLPCYILNPPGVYTQSDKFYNTSLKAGNAYLYNSCRFGYAPNVEEQVQGLYFSISYNYSDLCSIRDEVMELQIEAEDGLCLIEFDFNLLEMIKCCPVKLNVREISAGTIQFSEEFEYQKEEITVDFEDGEEINFPLTVKGEVKGIGRVGVRVSRGEEIIYQDVFEVDDNSYSAKIDSLDVIEGDNLIISVFDFDEESLGFEYDIVSVDVIFVESDPVPVIVKADKSFPNGTLEAPTAVGGKPIVKIGQFVAEVGSDYKATNFIISSHDYPLGLCTENLRVVVNTTQFGGSIATLEDSAAQEYNFSQNYAMERGVYLFEIFVDTKSISEPAMFKLRFAIEGVNKANGEQFQTLFVEGQDICIIPD